MRRRSPKRKLQLHGLTHARPANCVTTAGARTSYFPRRAGPVTVMRTRAAVSRRASTGCDREHRDAHCPTTSPQARARPPASPRRRCPREAVTAPPSSAATSQGKHGLCTREVRGCKTQAERAGKQLRRITDDRPSRGNQPAKLLEPCGPDSRYRIELVDRAESTVLLPVVEDLLRGDRPDAGQRIELLERGAVQMHWSCGGTPPDAAAPGLASPRRGTTICSPSAIRAARLSSSICAFGVGPPARMTASATREPSFSV